MLFAPSGKGRKRQKKGEKGRFRPISGKGGQPPLKPPFVTPPFAAAQSRCFLPIFQPASPKASHITLMCCQPGSVRTGFCSTLITISSRSLVGLTSANTLLCDTLALPQFIRGRHGGGGKRRGVENLTNDTPPKKGFWTPPPTVRFPPPSGVSALFFLYKNPRQSRPEALFEGSKNFRESAFSGTFSSPHTFCTPPYHRPNLFTPSLFSKYSLLAKAVGRYSEEFLRDEIFSHCSASGPDSLDEAFIIFAQADVPGPQSLFPGTLLQPAIASCEAAQMGSAERGVRPAGGGVRRVRPPPRGRGGPPKQRSRALSLTWKVSFPLALRSRLRWLCFLLALCPASNDMEVSLFCKTGQVSDPNPQKFKFPCGVSLLFCFLGGSSLDWGDLVSPRCLGPSRWTPEGCGAECTKIARFPAVAAAIFTAQKKSLRFFPPSAACMPSLLHFCLIQAQEGLFCWQNYWQIQQLCVPPNPWENSIFECDEVKNYWEKFSSVKNNCFRCNGGKITRGFSSFVP